MFVKRVIIPIAAILFSIATFIGFTINVAYTVMNNAISIVYLILFIFAGIIAIILSRVMDSLGPEVTHDPELYSYLSEVGREKAAIEHREIQRRSKPFFMLGLFIFISALISLIITYYRCG